MATDGEPKNGITSLLSTLAASGDNWVKMGIMAMIAVSGGGNFLATKQTAKATDHEISQALREIHDLHEQLNASIQRQKEIRDLLEKLNRKDNGNR